MNTYRGMSWFDFNSMMLFGSQLTVSTNQKNGYKFTINDRSAFYDWCNAYFEVQFQVQQLADGAAYGADRITVINGAHSLIGHMMIKSAGKIVCDTDNLHKVTFVKNLLEYSDDFSR